VPSQQATDSTSTGPPLPAAASCAPLRGAQDRSHTGPPRRTLAFSTPAKSRREMRPLCSPSASSWPSLVQAMLHTREATLSFLRELEGMVHTAKSTPLAVARMLGVMGLKASACTEAVCSKVYFCARSQLHTLTDLSPLPEAR
jgi:hypothetical protein